MKSFLFILTWLFTGFTIFSQNNSTMLEVESGTKGVILSRTVSSSILYPSDGMMIYDTVVHAFKYYNGSKWRTLIDIESNQFYYLDKDGDSFGDSLYALFAPNAPNSAYVENKGDCDDSNDKLNPNILEVCDGIDNDCDGEIDQGNTCPECAFGSQESMPCGTDIGQCAFGTMTRFCENGYWGPWGDCEGEIVATQEICDGLDNDCDGIVDEGFDFQTDPNNCGACGTVCNFTNAASTCVGGFCVMGDCDSGWTNCDGMTSTGCEADLMNDEMNCGTCGNMCPEGSICINGVCEAK